MSTVEIISRPTTVVTDDGTTVIVLGAAASTKVLMVDPAGNPGPYIDMLNAQDGDVLEVDGANLVPTRHQKNQVYDGGNF